MDLKIIFSTTLEVVFLENLNENFSHGNTLPGTDSWEFLVIKRLVALTYDGGPFFIRDMFV